jgi:hypothetical protein
MIPEQDYRNVYIDGISAVHLVRSAGRPGSNGDGFSMWSCNAKPLGWVGDGCRLIECVVAAQLISGELDPYWEAVPTGARLIHPRYTLRAEKTPKGWLPKIEDGLIGRTHSLKPQNSKDEAMAFLDDLLRRRVGRTKPVSDWQWWFGPAEEYHSNYDFQHALHLIAPDIHDFVRNGDVDAPWWPGERRASGIKFAKSIDRICGFHLETVPRIGTILATYIKSTLIGLYAGADKIQINADGSALTFTKVELAAFRERFRRSPVTDRQYLDFVNNNFVLPLQRLRRGRRRWPNRPVADKKSYRPILHARRDRDDFLAGWPFPPGSRPWPVETAKSDYA